MHAHEPCSEGSHSHHPSKLESSALRRSLVVTALFCLVELVMGFISGSLALIGDAGHMAVDSLALGASYLFVWLVERKKISDRMSEILGACFNGSLLLVLAISLFIEVAFRESEAQVIRAGWVIMVGIIGLGVNIYSISLLHPFQSKSLNARGAYLHVVMDCLGSVGAIASGIGVYSFQNSKIDSWFACGFAILVAFGALRLIRDGLLRSMKD